MATASPYVVTVGPVLSEDIESASDRDHVKEPREERTSVDIFAAGMLSFPTPLSPSPDRGEFLDCGRDSTFAVLKNLPSFSFVIARLFFYIFVVLIVVIPSFCYKATDAGSIICGAVVGLASIIPITALVLRADPSAKTPWLWCEVAAILVCGASYSSWTYFVAVEKDVGWSQTLVSMSTTVAFVTPLLVALRKGGTSKDLRRIKLCLATAVWPPLFLIPSYLNLLPPSIDSIFRYSVLFGALFIGTSLCFDRKNHALKNSVPYAAAYGWGLSTSVVSFLTILGASSLNLLVLNIMLSVNSTFILWCFWHMSSRITTERDVKAFLLPGFFAVEMFQVVVYATAKVQLFSYDFVATLAYQELASLVRNLGVTGIVWHRLMCALGRENASEHPFGSRRSMKTVLHRAVADSIAELMGILTVYAVASFETLLAYLTDDTLTCSVASCREQSEDLELLLLYGIVLLTRVLFLVLERALLVRMIDFYVRAGAAKIHASKASLGFVKAPVPFTIKPFKHEVRKLLGSNHASTTSALVVAVFILVFSASSFLLNDEYEF